MRDISYLHHKSIDVALATNAIHILGGYRSIGFLIIIIMCWLLRRIYLNAKETYTKNIYFLNWGHF